MEKTNNKKQKPKESARELVSPRRETLSKREKLLCDVATENSQGSLCPQL